MDDARKSKSALDKLPEPEQQKVFAFIERTTLDKATAWICKHYQEWLPGGKLSAVSVAKWAGKMRKKMQEALVVERLLKLQDANELADRLAADVGKIAKLNDANVMLLSQALLDAQLVGDKTAMKALTAQFMLVLGTVNQAREVDVKKTAADTLKAKFYFDAAKQALKHAAALKAINESEGTDREKIDRAVEKLFGKRPASPKAEEVAQ
jgi:hypothetical protein